MEARVKKDYRFPTVIAFSGHEYLKTDWRPVPETNEEEALRHPFLEVRDVTVEKLIITDEEPAESKADDSKGGDDEKKDNDPSKDEVVTVQHTSRGAAKSSEKGK